MRGCPPGDTRTRSHFGRSRVINLRAVAGKTTRQASFSIRNAGTSNNYVRTAEPDSTNGFFPETGSWFHLAATASLAGKMALWRDGLTRDEWTEDNGVAVNPNSVVYKKAALGRYKYGGDSYFKGAFRDVRIYARALPGSELAARGPRSSAA